MSIWDYLPRWFRLSFIALVSGTGVAAFRILDMSLLAISCAILGVVSLVVLAGPQDG